MYFQTLVKHLKTNSNAEVLWLFLRSKSQFRFKGKIKELKVNTKYWDSLNVLFYTSGSPQYLNEHKFGGPSSNLSINHDQLFLNAI